MAKRALALCFVAVSLMLPGAVSSVGAQPAPVKGGAPPGAKSVMRRAVALMRQARLARKAGKRDEAIRLLYALIRLRPFPRNPKAMRFLGLAYVQLGEKLLLRNRVGEAYKVVVEGMRRTAPRATALPTIHGAELYKVMSRIEARRGKLRQAKRCNAIAIKIYDRLSAGRKTPQLPPNGTVRSRPSTGSSTSTPSGGLQRPLNRYMKPGTR